ncbi:MAG: hypothetical protein HQL63_16120 [Magnetococcales bacterium]|nr:hypothetical protein [Magnetococcales bacterium]
MTTDDFPFPLEPAITLRDPMTEFLGAGSGLFTYNFADVVKLAGHACPTVAGAFLMVVRALELLYPNDMPERGDVAIVIPGLPDQGVHGPISQVFTLVTGAAGENGFHGLGGRFVRKDLLRFDTSSTRAGPWYCFRRLSNGKSVYLSYSPQAIPPDPGMSQDMELVVAGHADAATRERFKTAWRQRVQMILADGGRRTIRQR